MNAQVDLNLRRAHMSDSKTSDDTDQLYDNQTMADLANLMNLD